MQTYNNFIQLKNYYFIIFLTHFCNDFKHQTHIQQQQQRTLFPPGGSTTCQMTPSCFVINKCLVTFIICSCILSLLLEDIKVSLFILLILLTPI